MSASNNHTYRFAIQGGPFADPVALGDYVRRVEELGYVEFYTSDHIGWPGSAGRKGGKYVVDPFLPLIVAAGATSTLRLGPLVLNTEFYNPALLARTVATADRMTGGRIVLGLGTGCSGAEHDSIGVPIRPPGPRVSRFEETLIVLRALLNDGTVDHSGEFESVRFDDVGVNPVQNHVPFLVGGHGQRVVRLAGEYADIFQFTGLTHAKDGAPSAGGFALADVVERGRWLSEAAGDRDPSIERSALVQFTACGDSAPSSAEVAEEFELDADVVEESPFVLFGSVEQIVDKIERIRERVGITHYVVRDPEGFAPIVEALRGR